MQAAPGCLLVGSPASQGRATACRTPPTSATGAPEGRGGGAVDPAAGRSRQRRQADGSGGWVKKTCCMFPVREHFGKFKWSGIRSPRAALARLRVFFGITDDSFPGSEVNLQTSEANIPNTDRGYFADLPVER
eukprot:13788993-Alexandrium_andersonii.AAC.1